MGFKAKGAALALCAVLGLAGGARAAGQENARATRAQSGMRRLAQANNAFALKFYRKAGAGNLACSPYGLSQAYAMAYAGAYGATAAEIAQAFGFPAQQGELHRAFAELSSALAKSSGEGMLLQTATALWPDKGQPLVPAYTRAMQKYYGAPVRELDFAKAPSSARNTINAWAAKHTRGLIKNLLGPDAVDSSTRLVLTSAAYFKGLWLSAFDKKRTENSEFSTAAGEIKKVPTMYQQGKQLYAEDEGVQALSLPYKGRRASLLLLLPREGHTLAELENRLDEKQLALWAGALKLTDAHVFLPRFKIASDLDLNAALGGLGINAAFTPQADFTALSRKGGLFISRTLQKAVVEVNEEGTEAAAATAIAFVKSSMGRQPESVYFRADRPFLYLLRHEPTGQILFMGRVEDPSL